MFTEPTDYPTGNRAAVDNDADLFIWNPTHLIHRRGIETGRLICPHNACAPGEIRTPNLLIRSPSFGVSQRLLACQHAHVILRKYPEISPSSWALQ